MKPFILIFKIDDYDEIIQKRKFDTQEAMDLFVNSVKTIHIYFCGRIVCEYEYNPIETVTKLKSEVKIHN